MSTILKLRNTNFHQNADVLVVQTAKISSWLYRNVTLLPLELAKGYMKYFYYSSLSKESGDVPDERSKLVAKRKSALLVKYNAKFGLHTSAAERI